MESLQGILTTHMYALEGIVTKVQEQAKAAEENRLLAAQKTAQAQHDLTVAMSYGRTYAKAAMSVGMLKGGIEHLGKLIHELHVCITHMYTQHSLHNTVYTTQSTTQHHTTTPHNNTTQQHHTTTPHNNTTQQHNTTTQHNNTTQQ
jgi:hypothetical protein